MKKITAIIASRKQREKSNTACLVNDVLASVQYAEQVDVEIFYLSELRVTPCVECETCFRYGMCPLDEKDDMKRIKQRILDSDYIIWGSGILLHNVNSLMNQFLERISAWVHLFRMAGIGSTVLLTTSTNGYTPVISYMKKILSFMGSSIDDVTVLTYQEFINTELYDEVVRNTVGYILPVLREEKMLASNELQERIFQAMKQVVLTDQLSEYEASYWEKEGILSYDSFGEYIRNK